jgi:lysophospholipase L1-like esterase
MLRVTVRVTDGKHRLQVSPAGDGPVRIFGISMERDRRGGVIVDSIGIRGREARDWLAWEPTMFEQGVQALAPDLVVLAYGTNEAADQRYTMEEYRADLSAVLTKLRGAVTAEQVPCVLAGPSDRGWKYERGRYAIWDRTRPVAQVQREVAAEHGCAFWDWQAAMGGDGSMIGWYYADPKLGAGDFIHHTRAGYVWIADRFLRALDPGMAKR